jgi:hypothetical protein
MHVHIIIHNKVKSWHGWVNQNPTKKHLAQSSFGKIYIMHNVGIRWCNLNLGLATNARACEGASQEWSLGITFHAPESVGECEGMNPHTPKWTLTLGIGTPIDFQIFRWWSQGSKLIGLKNYLYHWFFYKT